MESLLKSINFITEANGNPNLIILENEEIFEKNKKSLNKFKEIIILIDPSKKFYNYPDIQKRKNLKKNKAKVSKNEEIS